ncbi:MAG: 4Fe-4S dicluster domain-containing protein [Candidatus Freyarchaeota archaeon]|nr:4Fe-4S dicluster domain-containing protein [Candidatus Jordarchaeia archaeon]
MDKVSVLLTSKWNWKLLEEAKKWGIERPEECLSCGACVGACPAARTSSYNFRKVVRDVMLGNEEKVLSSREIWYCFYCFYCTSKCPSKVEIPYFIMRLRRMAIERGYGGDILRVVISTSINLMERGVSVLPSDYDRMSPASAEESMVRLRESLGLPPVMRVSEKAMEELKTIFKETGFEDEVERIRSGKWPFKGISEKY